MTNSDRLIDNKLEIQVQERIAELEKVNQELGAEILGRKRAEEKLRYHANLVNNVSDAIISTDKELKIRSWNKAAERIYGWQANEVIGLKGSDVLQTTFPEGISREAITKDIFEKGYWEGELIQRTKDGADITVYAKSMALKDETGVVIGGVSISSDITERKKAEEKIQHLADIVESSGDPILTVSLEGIITSWNKGAEQVYGYSAEEILGKNYSIIEPANLKGEIKKLIERVKNNEKIRYHETLRLKKTAH